jgi:hypothetical protein
MSNKRSFSANVRRYVLQRFVTLTCEQVALLPSGNNGVSPVMNAASDRYVPSEKKQCRDTGI